MKPSCALALLVLAAGLPRHPLSAQAPPVSNKKSCIAFQQGFDIWSRCSLNGERLLKRVPGLKSWAVDPKKELLVAVRENVNGSTLQIFRIRDGHLIQARKVSSKVLVVRTCGTVVQMEQKGDVTQVFDAFTLIPIPLKEPADSIRCSEDRSVVITGILAPAKGIRYKLARSNGIERTEMATDVLNFDLSPSGSFLAFSQDTRICAVRTNEPADSTCIELVWSEGPLSINDKGRILFAAQTDEECGTHHMDPCLAVFEWEFGAPNDFMVKFRAWSPIFY